MPVTDTGSRETRPGSRRVAILPDAVADQIAAGEVVERPASVVKELVENAVDAGATVVRINLTAGGKTLIEVSDDGSGMGRDDAILALDRHATSKIRAAADLVGVTTFGFRGEALPAIASVSRFALTTSDGRSEGTEVRVTGGRLDHVGPVARQRGTTVAVRALFFNTPARRKFLRSVSSETRSAHNAVATMALSHPDVGFELTVDGRPRLFVPPGQHRRERLAAVWGPDIVDSLIPVDGAAGAFFLEGYIQRPGESKPTGRRTQLLVNGRPFKDPFLIRAAEAGYRAAIHPGDRPSMFLAVRVDPDQVDVNVHPTKLEVRFRDHAGLERVVEDTVRMTLGELVSSTRIGDWRPRVEAAGGQTDFRELFPDAGSAALPGGTTGEDTEATEPARPEAGAAPTRLSQLFLSYIVYESAHGLVFVDQHSAHERILYERVMAQLSGEDAVGQRLLIPLTTELTDEELDVLEDHGDTIARIGYEVEGFGGRTVKIAVVPNPHPRFDPLRCFREMVADLARGRFGGWSNALERFAATFACRAAVKAGEPLDDREMRELLAQLFATALPPHDVHGRSTIVQLPREELERRFGRR